MEFDRSRSPLGAGGSGGTPLVVELSAWEAANGTVRMVAVPASLGLDQPAVAVAIPAGTAGGAVLRVPVAGGTGPADLLVQVRLRPGPRVQPGLPAAAAGIPTGTAARAGAPAGGRGGGHTGPARAGRWRSGRAGPGRRSRTRTAAAGSIAVLVVAAAVAVAVGSIGSDGGPDRASAAGGPAAPATSGAGSPGLAPAAYQRTLTEFDRLLAADLRRVQRAGTPGRLRRSVETLAISFAAQARALESLDPPAAVAAAHTAVVDAAYGIAEDLDLTAAAAAGRHVCGGAAANSLFSRADGTARLRAAAARLAAADRVHRYRVGTFLPRATPLPNRRIANGTALVRATRGDNELRVRNGAALDVVLTLVPAGRREPALTLYLRGRASARVTGIGDGRYAVYTTNGRDWDPAAKAFTRECSFQRWDVTLNFTSDPSHYTVESLRLWAERGMIESADVDPEQFPGGR